ncbi:MAG: hypothetical protein AB8B74_07345 [Crocinitomicaceae bacterium]
MPSNDSISKIQTTLDSAKVDGVSKIEPTYIIVKDTIIQAPAQLATSTNGVEAQSVDLVISPIVIIIFIGLGVGLYFLMTFLRKYILPVIVQRYQKQNIKLFWFRFSSIIWFAFGLLTLYVFLKGSVVITSITIITVGVIFHNFIFDFMLGIYFQFENHIKRKAQFKLGNIEGEVHSFHTRHLKVLDMQSEEIYIPYRNLLSEPVRIVKHVDSLVEKSFLMTLSGDPTKNVQLLQKYMTMCPWTHDNSLYKVEHLDKDQFQISVRVKETFTANKIATFIQSKVN